MPRAGLAMRAGEPHVCERTLRAYNHITLITI